MSTVKHSSLEHRLAAHLHTIYPHLDAAALASECLLTMHLEEGAATPPPHQNLWSEQDIMGISYGDSIRCEGEMPLQTLTDFLKTHFNDSLTTLHILPFFPYSSDDGFSVMDYTNVNAALGDWNHISRLTQSFKVMSDLVINHCSSRSLWFDNFRHNLEPGASYFRCVPADTDTSMVVRPRTSPLLREVQTNNGIKYVWCTFSHDQVDLNFESPAVLFEFLRIIKLYLDKGIRWFRLDAVAFLWKIPGTNCINLPQTHEVIRLLRLLIEHYAPDAVIITETNIPNHENLTYFGNANEAHLIYNFSLPPLLINTLITGDCTHLKNWLMTMPPAQNGTTYLNFIASHDGVGLRPTEGLLSDWELNTLITTMQRFGGKISSRSGPDGAPKPYEMNISLWSALSGSVRVGPDSWHFARYICAHTIMLALEGIPAFYIHSLIATENDYERIEHTGHFRSINRHIWDKNLLEDALASDTHHSRVASRLKELIHIRRQQSAFHPNATQYVLHLGEGVFAFWRQSLDGKQSIFALHNISDQAQCINMAELNLLSTDTWTDLISGTAFHDHHCTLTLTPYQCLWLANC
jgi:sucrose phosphorylase